MIEIVIDFTTSTVD